MNSTIRPTLLPAAPGLSRARLPDKVQAVDGHASFAAALKTLSEHLADLPLAAAEASAAQGKLPQRGKSLKATDEAVDGNLAMLAAAAMPHPTGRSAAPLRRDSADAHNVLAARTTGPEQETLRSGRVEVDGALSVRAERKLAATPETGAAARVAGETAALRVDSPAGDSNGLLARTAAVPASGDAGALRGEVPLSPTGTPTRTIATELAPAAGALARCLAATESRVAAADADARAAGAELLPAAQLQVKERGILAREDVEAKAQASVDAPSPGLLAPLALPGAASTHAASQPAPAMQVGPLVGSSDWGEVLARHLVRLAPGGRREVELNLHPAELGPLKVTLSLAEGHAQVLFVSEHPAVRQALEAALPQLRTTFADNGISLGQASVGSGSSEHRPENGPGGHHRSHQTDPARFGAPPPDKPQHVALAGRSSESAVDTFA